MSHERQLPTVYHVRIHWRIFSQSSENSQRHLQSSFHLSKWRNVSGLLPVQSSYILWQSSERCLPGSNWPRNNLVSRAHWRSTGFVTWREEQSEECVQGLWSLSILWNMGIQYYDELYVVAQDRASGMIESISNVNREQFSATMNRFSTLKLPSGTQTFEVTSPNSSSIEPL